MTEITTTQTDEHTDLLERKALLMDDRLSPRNAKIVARAAMGHKHADIAAEHGITRQRVGQVLDAKRETYDLLRRDLKLSLLMMFDERKAKVASALMDSAEDPTNRNQAQAARVVAEMTGVIDRANRTHIGDTHVHGGVQIDMRSVVLETFDTGEASALLDSLGAT